MAAKKYINIRAILQILGLLLIIEAFFMLFCIPFSWYYGSTDFFDWNIEDANHDFWPLVISAAITFISGIILYFGSRKAIREDIGKREGYIIVSIAWVVISLFGALPYILSGSIPNFTNAFFETISGFTTTGSTILNDIEALPKGILFWRAIFTVLSIMGTSGFVTSDYMMWPGALWFIIFMLMFVGGSAGSTGGGIKVVRHMLLLKNSLLELKRLLHPQAVIPVRMNGRPVSQEIIFKVLAFFLMYIIVFAAGVFALSICGLDFETSVGASISSIGNIGPGIGKVGPAYNFTVIPDPGKWVLMILMILGRLEFFTVLILFSPAFWKR
jgi:Trk-type K+ transport system membrane component